jgi:hypothetical protein
MVEWGDRIGPLLPPDRLEIRLDLDAADDRSRRVTIRPAGRAWAGRGDALGGVVAGV